MSYYISRPTPPRPATQEEVSNQIDQLRRQLQQQLAQAQQSAINEATLRASELQKEQIRRIQNSLKDLDEASRRNLEALDHRHRQQLEKITTRIYDDIQRNQSNMEKAQARMEKRINSQLEELASDVSDQIKGLDNHLERQQRDINTINNQMNAIVNEINDLSAEIDHRFAENERSIADIQSDLANIHRHINDKEEKARESVKTARNLLGVVEQRSMLDRFAPAYEAQDVRNRVIDLQNSSLTGDALRAKAEEAITQIWQTERHATLEKAKHDALVEIAHTQIARVLTVVNDNREVNQEIEGGEAMKVECEFWSEGEFGRLEKELEDLKAELDDRYNRDLTKKRIDQIIRRSSEIEGRILQICAESVSKAILSEARVETVEDIVNAMESKGWTLKCVNGKPEFDYMGGDVDHDWRKGVCAILENNVGEEITIIMDPVSESQNHIIVHQETSRDGNTERRVAEQMQTVVQEMSDLGYQLGEPVPGVANMPEMGSTERLGRAHATEKIQQKMCE